jgi:hypothetical protein
VTADRWFASYRAAATCNRKPSAGRMEIYMLGTPKLARTRFTVSYSSPSCNFIAQRR